MPVHDGEGKNSEGENNEGNSDKGNGGQWWKRIVPRSIKKSLLWRARMPFWVQLDIKCWDHKGSI